MNPYRIARTSLVLLLFLQSGCDKGLGALVMRGADSVLYSMTLQPGIYPYVAVAHQFGPDLFADWRPVGQYDLDTNPQFHRWLKSAWG